MLHLGATVRAVTVIGAHPDDIEIGAGGLLLALPANISVNYVLLTGSSERHQEAREAARAFLPRATLTFTLHSLPDGHLPACWSTVKDVIETAAAEVEADLVLGPSSTDAHQDHRLLGELIPTAFRDAMILNYEVPKWDGDFGQPNVYIPVSNDVVRQKIQLLSRHYSSQAHRHWWTDDVFLGLARLRGMECRCKYAEAFMCRKLMVEFLAMCD